MDDQLRSIISGDFVATGVALDDHAASLFESVEDYSNDHGTPIKVRIIGRADDRFTPIEAAKGQDFVVVDHQLEDKFVGFRDGLELAEEIRRTDERMPLFYCSAFQQDFYRGPDGNRHLTPRARFLESSPYTFSYGKDDLAENRKLREFVEIVYYQALGHAMARILSTTDNELRRVLASRRLGKQERLYRLSGSAGRGWVRAEALDDGARDEVIPVRFLRRAGIRGKNRLVKHKIFEYEVGAVLSFFDAEETSAGDLSSRALEIIKKAKVKYDRG